jgi:hypothetical protein
MSYRPYTFFLPSAAAPAPADCSCLLPLIPKPFTPPLRNYHLAK